MCWCHRAEVLIPVEWVSEGRTRPCTKPGCEPGCEITDEDDHDHDHHDHGHKPDSQRRLKMNRFKTENYAPIDDSSVDYKVGTGLRKQYPSALILAISDGDCPCGCAAAPKGKTATFGMGHDIRLRGKLIRAASAGAKVIVVDPQVGTHVELDPIAYAATFSTPKLDWAASVQAGVDRVAKRGHADKAVLEVATGPQVGDRELLKVGRWNYDGRVVAVYRDGSVLEFEYSDKKGVVHRVRRDAEGHLEKVAS